MWNPLKRKASISFDTTDLPGLKAECTNRNAKAQCSTQFSLPLPYSIPQTTEELIFQEENLQIKSRG